MDSLKVYSFNGVTFNVLECHIPENYHVCAVPLYTVTQQIDLFLHSSMRSSYHGTGSLMLHICASVCTVILKQFIQKQWIDLPVY